MSAIPGQTRYGCYIGNIDRSVTVDMLKQVFCQCGTIIDCSLNGRENDAYRFGFIDFATEDDRSRALKYNGFTLVGRKLRVGISKGNVNKPDGFASGNPGGSGSPGHSLDRQRRGDGDGGHGGHNNNNAGGLSVQQQIEARLLLQFIQEGKMDPRQLSPAQQLLLIAALGNGGAAGGGSSGHTANPATAAAPMSSGGMSGGSAQSVTPPQQQPAPMMDPMMMMGGGMVPPVPSQGLPMMSANLTMGGPAMGHSGGGGGVPMMNNYNMRNNMNNNMYPNNMMMQQQQQQRSPQPWGAPASYGAYSPMAPSYPTPSQSPYASGGVMQPGSGAPQAMNAAVTGAASAPPSSLAGGATGNAPPTAEALRLREKQREQFFDVVRKDTERYERKVQEKKARAAAGGSAGDHGRSDSSASEEDEEPEKKAKKE